MDTRSPFDLLGEKVATTQVETLAPLEEKTAFGILAAISLCHLMNDMLSSVLPAIYPMLKTSFHLDFAQVGLITLTYQMTASLLQPLVGMYTDRRPMPYSLSAGMGISLVGLLILAMARNFQTFFAARRWWALDRRCFIPSRRGWRGWRLAGSTGWRNRFFRWEEMRGWRWDRCLWRSSCCREDKRAWRGFRWLR